MSQRFQLSWILHDNLSLLPSLLIRLQVFDGRVNIWHQLFDFLPLRKREADASCMIREQNCHKKLALRR